MVAAKVTNRLWLVPGAQFSGESCGPRGDRCVFWYNRQGNGCRDSGDQDALVRMENEPRCGAAEEEGGGQGWCAMSSPRLCLCGLSFVHEESLEHSPAAFLRYLCL